MVRKYSDLERSEAVKLADEIGPPSAAVRLGIPINTIYGWQGRARQKAAFAQSVISEMGPEAVVEENARLKRELARSRAEVEILQDALGFFVER